jgi:lysophospholipase L1-like esterase
MANLAAIISRIRKGSEAPILIYNLSPIVARETIHCYLGIGETVSTRIRRFNLGLAELSEETGVSIVDVDTIVARHGADALKIDAMHLTPEGYELVAREVVRVLEDLGLFEDERD